MDIPDKKRKQILVLSTTGNPLQIPLKLSNPAPQWEPKFCHHAANCGVDKESLAVGAENIWFC